MDVAKKHDEKNTSLSEASNINHHNYPEVIGITACPTGIAHTYMAKDKIVAAASKLNMTCKVETQGRSGNEDVLTQAEIDNAKVIIFAADKTLTGLSRFQSKKVLEVSTKDAIYNSEKLINDYLNNTAKLTTIKTSENKQNIDDIDFSFKNFANIKKNLLAGISRMLPFVVAAGIIIGFGFLLDIGTGTDSNKMRSYGQNRVYAAWFTTLGQLVMGLMIPVLGGYICYAIVGAQGLLPGFVAGLIAGAPKTLYNEKSWGYFFPGDMKFNSGFIGAIIGAYFAAFIVYGLIKGLRKIPRSIAGIRDIVIIPVFSVLGTAVVMFVMNIPLGYLNQVINIGLINLSHYSYLSVIVGILIGLMMSSDMGGPINKAAYAASLATLDSQQGLTELSTNNGTIFMAASMLTGMVPPLVTALSTLMFPSCWNKKDIEAGRTNWFLSAGFITEGVIPFAAADPKRVISSSLVGSAITGAIVSAFGITLAAPHGGIFVFPLLGLKKNNWLNIGSSSSWIIPIAVIVAFSAIFIGALVGATILGLWKKHDIKNNKLVIS